MKKYWFKKNTGGKGFIPTTWQGVVLFILVIGLVTQSSNFVDGIVQIVLLSGLVAGVGYWLIGIKTDPVEIYDRTKDKIGLKEGLYSVIAIIVLIVIAISIGFWRIDQQHSTIGYPVRITNEQDWFEFHAIKDDFVIELPNYPKYTLQNQKIENTDIVLTIATYVSKAPKFGDFIITLINLPEKGNYSDTETTLSNALSGMKSELKAQTGEEPIASSSPVTSFLSFPSKTTSLEGNSTDYRIMTLYILSNKKLYSFSYNSSKQNFDTNNFYRFINSLRFEEVNPK